MKRSWIGLGLLLVLLAVSLLATWAMGQIHEPIAVLLQQAAERTMLGDWDSADRFFQSAREGWDSHAHLRASLADHSPVEEIDALFAQLSVYCAAREEVAFSAGCMELSEKVTAVGEAHGLVWWNIL